MAYRVFRGLGNASEEPLQRHLDGATRGQEGPLDSLLHPDR